MKLTEAEWDELVEAISDSEISARVLPIVEAIIAARLADVRALADEWEAAPDAVCCDQCQAVAEARRDAGETLRAVVDGQAPAQAAESEWFGPNRECDATLNLAGENYPCQTMKQMAPGSTNHDGWAHMNPDADAIWDAPAHEDGQR